MTYTEYLAYCEENQITPHGTTVWVTDVRKSEGETMLRNIRAEKMVVVSNESINKKCNSTEYSLQKIGKRGKPLKSYVSMYDNSVSSYLSGTSSVNIYVTEYEAKVKLSEQLTELEEHYIKKYNEYKDLMEETRKEIDSLNI